MKLDWQATPIAPRNEAARKAVLVVEDGTVFRGRGLGAFGPRGSVLQHLDDRIPGDPQRIALNLKGIAREGFPVTTSRACDRTIGPRTRTRWCDDESASCSASNHRAPPSASSACMPLSTTHSTCSGILSLAQLSGPSDHMRLRNGAAQPPPRDARARCTPSRPKRLNLTMPFIGVPPTSGPGDRGRCWTVALS